MIAADNVLLTALCIVLTAYTFILLIMVSVSWAVAFGFRPPLSGPGRTLLDLLDDVTQPVLRPLRALIPPVRAGGVGFDVYKIARFKTREDLLARYGKGAFGHVVGVAGGPQKENVVRGVLRGGWINALITDQGTARRVLER